MNRFGQEDFRISRMGNKYHVAPQTMEASTLMGPARIWTVTDCALVLEAYTRPCMLPDMVALYLERQEVARREYAALVERLRR